MLMLRGGRTGSGAEQEGPGEGIKYVILLLQPEQEHNGTTRTHSFSCCQECF